MAILQLLPPWLREQPDAYLFPGWVPLLLVIVGLLWGLLWRSPSTTAANVDATAVRPWWQRQRHNHTLFYALLTIFCAWLLLGPPWGIWPFVYKWPVLSFIRVPTRFVLLGLLGLGVLCGLAFDRITARCASRARAITAAAICALALIEFASMPLEGRPYDPALPKIDVWMNTLPKPFTIAEWPMPHPDNVDGQNARNARFMLHSTAHFQPTVHGFSGILPKEHEALFGALYKFPDDDSLRRLRAFNVTYVVWHDDFTDPKVKAETDGIMAPFNGRIQFVHEEADGRVYRLVR